MIALALADGRRPPAKKATVAALPSCPSWSSIQYLVQYGTFVSSVEAVVEFQHVLPSRTINTLGMSTEPSPR